jgi:hypothetical protein
MYQQMQERGWSDPVALLSAQEGAKLAELGKTGRSFLLGPETPKKWRPTPNFNAKPWFKSLHAISPEFFDLAIHPTILESVKTVLGHDILVWGVSVLNRRPGQVHRWHIDVEHIAWKGVSVFVGLSGVRPLQSSLKFISGSHRFRRGPSYELGEDDDVILAQARTADPECTMDYPAMGDGEFIMFDGPMWHASHNTSTETRYATIIQYTTPSETVAVPLTWTDPIMWASHKPPCILASGRDEFGRNTLIDRPSGSPVEE